jgi:hypothetical protein
LRGSGGGSGSGSGGGGGGGGGVLFPHTVFHAEDDVRCTALFWRVLGVGWLPQSEAYRGRGSRG